MQRADDNTKNIVLTGFMGVGKTTVGKELAKRLEAEFFDTDEIIEKEEGKTVADIFEQDGEDYFRKREAEVFRRLMDRNSAVISTGGGTFENPDVRRLAKERVISVCLLSSVEGLLKRMNQLKEGRPMLRTKTAEEIRALYAVVSVLQNRPQLLDRAYHVLCKSPLRRQGPPYFLPVKYGVIHFQQETYYFQISRDRASRIFLLFDKHLFLLDELDDFQFRRDGILLRRLDE